MHKIPIGRSIAHAYEFLFGRAFPIIGLAWLPALFYAVGYYLWLHNIAGLMPGNPADSMAVLHLGALYIGAVLGALLLHAVIAIALTQEAFGIRKDIALAHFVIGPRELRLFFALVRFYLLFAVLYAAWVALTVLGFMAVRHFAGQVAATSALVFHGIPLLPVALGVVSLVFLVTLVLALLRLSFLLAPIASVEKHVPLLRSWTLTRGSAWRIAIVYLAIALPVLAVVAASFWLMAGDALLKTIHDIVTTRPRDPHLLLEFESAQALVLATISGLVLIVFSALQAGATAAAYRTVTGHEEDDSDDDAALVAPLLVPIEALHHEPVDELPSPVADQLEHHPHQEEPAEHGHQDHDSSEQLDMPVAPLSTEEPDDRGNHASADGEEHRHTNHGRAPDHHDHDHPAPSDPNHASNNGENENAVVTTP